MTKGGHNFPSAWLLFRTVINACVENFIEERLIPSAPSQRVYFKGRVTMQSEEDNYFYSEHQVLANWVDWSKV